MQYYHYLANYSTNTLSYLTKFKCIYNFSFPVRLMRKLCDITGNVKLSRNGGHETWGINIGLWVVVTELQRTPAYTVKWLTNMDNVKGVLGQSIDSAVVLSYIRHHAVCTKNVVSGFGWFPDPARPGNSHGTWSSSVLAVFRRPEVDRNSASGVASLAVLEFWGPVSPKPSERS